MAKIYGLSGTLIGRRGNDVFLVNHGTQLVRAYQPSVANPSTEAQVETRAKLKLLSQLSAVLGPVVAIRREGMRSPRNLFTRDNYALAGYAGGTATINLNAVQLTKSAVGMSGFSADRSSGTAIAVSVLDDVHNNFDRVVYVGAVKQADNTLRLLGSVVATEAGANGTFPAELPYTANAVVVYAYGMRDNTDAARAAFANMHSPTAEMVASLVVSRRLLLNDVTMTETRGLTLNVGETSGDSESFERATITLSSEGNGVVTGAGRYIIGTTVAVRATAGENAEFVAWYNVNDRTTPLATTPSYAITVTEDMALVAVFRALPVTVTVTSANPEQGVVTGGGQYELGSQATVRATAAVGYVFKRWKANGTVVSTVNPYTFTVANAVTLVAEFEEASSVNMTVTSSNLPAGIESSNAGSYTAGSSVTPTFTLSSHFDFKDYDKTNSIKMNGVADGDNWSGSGRVYTRISPIVLNDNVSFDLTLQHED